MKKIATAITLLVLAITSQGCRSYAKNFNMISAGMSKQEVVEIMGQPIHTKSPNKGDEVLVYNLKNNISKGRAIEEHFIKIHNGCVESFGALGDFDSTKDPAIVIKTINESKIETKVDGKGQPKDLYTELRKLKELKADGIINEDEFNAQKKALLGGK